MKLNERQKQAVEYLDGPLLVLAGPGTGKTQLLSEKVAHILKTTDTSPENILCLTFTESGARNMRERLKTIIKSDADKVNIGTYHAFGSDILAQYKNYSTDYDRHLDSAIDEVSAFKIIKKIQSDLPGTDILRGDSIKDIIAVISSAKSANLTAEDFDTIADQNLADSEILSAAISPLLKNLVPAKFQPSLENTYEPISILLAPYENAKPILKNIDRSIKPLATDLSAALAEAKSTNRLKPLSAWKDKYFEKSSSGDYRLKDRIANKKLKSLAQVYKNYQSYLLTHGLYDFADMIGEAVRVLKTDTGFRLTLSEKYQYILLDEFQDTNPSQFEIIKQLTDYEKPIIMAVGDDDQAIYEFQGASATNLMDFQSHYSANVIPLIDNYRSTGEILDFSRAIINQATDRFADKILTAHQATPVPSAISRHEFISSDAEYAWVADQIKNLIVTGTSPSEIAVISYKTKYFLPLLPFLKSHPEINIAYEKKDDLLADSRIYELITLSRFIAALASEKDPKTSILEILSFPFWQLPMLEVVKTVHRAKTDKKSVFDYLASSDHPEIATLAHFFADLVAKSFETPLAIFLDYLLGTTALGDFRSPFLAYYTKNSGYDTFSLYEHLASLRGKLAKHFPDRAPKLKDLVELIDDYADADIQLSSSSPYRDAEEAVQVLTAHKAKGLEFKHVFIISADHVAWGKGKGNNNLLVLPKNLIQIRHTGTTDGEKLRILYVALTRAKTSLTITNSLKDFNDKSPDRLEYLNEYLDETKTLISPFLPTKNVVCHYEPASEAVATENLKNWLNPYLAPSPDLRAIYKERLDSYRFSATGLTSFIDIIYAGPSTFFRRQVLRAPDDTADESLVFGNLIHATFEKITNSKISDKEAIEFFLGELNRSPVEPEVLRHLREKGPLDLEISLKSFGKILRAGLAEVNLGSEKPSVAGIPLTGKIDHLLINEDDKTIEIYDFKTSKFHKSKWTSHPTLYKYALQLGLYKLLLNNSPTYRKYKVTRAHILFVSPDADGEVYDKVYNYSDADEAELIKLLKAVHYQVSTLAFLDDPELFIEPDKNRTIRELKSFITLLLEKQPK